MGGGSEIDGGGPQPFCDGQDVIDALNAAFGNVDSTIYATAQSGKVFENVTDGQSLATAYKNAGMSVSGNWHLYLTQLSPANAEAIAAARTVALNQGIPMTTSAHEFTNPVYHHVTITVAQTLATISSPYKNDVPPPTP